MKDTESFARAGVPSDRKSVNCCLSDSRTPVKGNSAKGPPGASLPQLSVTLGGRCFSLLKTSRLAIFTVCSRTSVWDS